MATISTSDISFLLSGGSTNLNPDLSLGGPPSSNPVAGNLNSLFRDVTPEEATAGLVEYRCFYISNSSESETLRGAAVQTSVQATGGAFVDLGVSRATESQRIEISGGVSSGSAEFRLGDASFSGAWSGSAESFRTSLLESLSSAGLGDVVVERSSGSTDVFTLFFSGSLDNKSHPLVELVDSSLSGESSVSISISRVTTGSPINTVAPLVPTRSTPPAGVTFLTTSASSKITIGNLGPGDSMPVWIRRTTPAGTEFKEGDSVTIRLSGDPFGPATQNPAPEPPSSSSSSVDCSDWPVSIASCPDLGPDVQTCSYDTFYENGCLSGRDCGVVVDGECVPLSDYLESLPSSSSSS